MSRVPIPASLLISIDPTQALKLNNQNNNNNVNINNSLYSHPRPPSKRLRRKKNQPHQQEPAAKTTNQSIQLTPALSSLPPTPLTPLEIINSTTLSRLFKRSNPVFSQIADSATGLIESDSAISNKLNQLVELLRGDLSSREWIQVIQNLIKPIDKDDDDQHHYHILTQTLETVQSLFSSPIDISFPVIAQPSSVLKSPHHLMLKRSSSRPSLLLVPPQPPQNSKQKQKEEKEKGKGKEGKVEEEEDDDEVQEENEILNQTEQIESLEASTLHLTRFLGDLYDYRDRLIEIRDGCLAIEKRRRALWSLIKICSKAFDQSVSSSPDHPLPRANRRCPPSSSSSSSSSSEVVVNVDHRRKPTASASTTTTTTATNGRTATGKFKKQNKQSTATKSSAKKARALLFDPVSSDHPLLPSSSDSESIHQLHKNLPLLPATRDSLVARSAPALETPALPLILSSPLEIASNTTGPLHLANLGSSDHLGQFKRKRKNV